MRHVDIKKGAPLSPNLVNLKSNTMIPKTSPNI